VWEYLQGQGSNKVKWDDVRQVYQDNRVNIVQLMKNDRLLEIQGSFTTAYDLEAAERAKPVNQAYEKFTSLTPLIDLLKGSKIKDL
jgi:hypothetical protein